MEFAPHPGPAPLTEAAVRGRPGRTEDPRQLPPRATGRGDEQDGSQHLAVAKPASATTLKSRRRAPRPGLAAAALGVAGRPNR